MIESLLDACQFVLESLGKPQTSYWLASQVVEMKLWRAGEADVRDALKKDIEEHGERALDLCSLARMSLRYGHGKPIRPTRILRSSQGLFLSGSWGSTRGPAS